MGPISANSSKGERLDIPEIAEAARMSIDIENKTSTAYTREMRKPALPHHV